MGEHVETALVRVGCGAGLTANTAGAVPLDFEDLALDNFVISETRLPTPEPATLALLALAGIPRAIRSLHRRRCPN